MISPGAARPSLESERFHVVIIGGGINGVAIARECARAGKRTLLIEQHDFAAGTTSRSTRIIHGGLRYLEHGEIGMVHESLHERQRLLRERPHLVHPVHFLLALSQGSRRSALSIRSGPWADRVCQRSGIDTRRSMVGGVRGSHIVLPRFAGVPDAAVYTEAVDGRPIFVIPWNEQVLVGTTEVSDSGDPSKVHPTSDEIEYLLRSLLQLFSRAKLSSRDIRYSFSGIRPLPFTPKAKPSAVTRKHYLHDHSDDGAAQMISVIGGKLTTAAQLARECADKIGARSGKQRELAVLSGDNLDPVLDQWVVEIADAGGISEDSARGIVEWHRSEE